MIHKNSCLHVPTVYIQYFVACHTLKFLPNPLKPRIWHDMKEKIK